MSTQKKQTHMFALVAAALLVFGGATAQATPLTLTLEAGLNESSLANLLTVVDGGVDDLDGAVDGSITVQYMFANGMDVFFSVGANAPTPGDLARLTLNTVHIQNSGEGSVRATLSQGGLGGGYTGDAAAVGAFWGQLQGSPGSNVSAQSWVNSSSVYDPRPVHTATVGGAEEFYFDTVQALNLTGDFSLTTQLLLNFAPGGGSPSLTDANVTVLPVESVPEPGSLLLFGSGLLGLATVVRRKRQKTAV